MVNDDQALSTRDSTAIVSVPEARLRPTSQRTELLTLLGAYFGLMLPAFVFFPPWAPMLIVFGLFGWAIHRRRSWYRSVAQQRAVQVALGNDDVDEAARLGQQLLMPRNTSGLAHSLAVTTWGAVELRRGRPRETIELLTRALGTRRFTGRTGRLVEAWRIEAGLAYAYAIVGEPSAAERHIAVAEAQMESNRTGALLTVRLCTQCRRGTPEAAITLLDAQWRTAETLLTVGGARTARMFEAFALEQRPSDEYRGDVATRAEKALDRAREARSGAYDYLAVEWPALADFLRRHRL